MTGSYPTLNERVNVEVILTDLPGWNVDFGIKLTRWQIKIEHLLN